MRGIDRRRLLTGAAGVAVAAGAVGCGTGRGELGDGSGDITIWTWPDNDRVIDEFIRPRFEQRHPDITLTVQGFDASGYPSKLLSALVSGTGPDVAMVEITHVSRFHDKPGFVDLSAPPFRAGRYADGYADFAMAYVMDQRSGRISLLPKNTAPGGLFYRRSALEEAGLPSEPDEVRAAFRTWEDFFEAGRRLVRETDRWLFDQPRMMVAAMQGQRGISYFDEHGDPQLESDAIREPVELIPKLKSDGLLAPSMSDQERGAAIGAGRIATFLNGNWFGGWLKGTYAADSEGDWGITLAPELDGTSAFNYGGDFIGILETSRKQRAAWTFVRWLTQDPGSLRQLYRQDLYPAWTEAGTREWINEPDEFYGGQNVNEVFREVSRTMRTPSTSPNDALARTALEAALDNVYSGAMSPRAALRRATEELEWKLA